MVRKGRYGVKNLLHRFRTTNYREEQRIHPAVHIFLAITLLAGIWFTFFGYTDAVQVSLLWQATNTSLTPWVMNLWGSAALLVTGLNTYGITQRKPRIHNAAAMGGFALWLYAAVMYLSGAFWFHLTVMALPNLAFWTYYYVATKARTGR